jgi:hypothetical protein
MKTQPLKVLVACEFSATVRDAFNVLGHEAWSCDVLPCEKGQWRHLQCDVREVLGEGWDMMIAHPPCTRLCNSGVRWMHERNLWSELREACDFFNALLSAPIGMIAVENPIQHMHARAKIERGYDQIIQPWQFGHSETKATCLWLKNLPKLVPTDIRHFREARVHRMPPGPDRWRERSRTYPGIATAMARQWSTWATGVDF